MILYILEIFLYILFLSAIALFYVQFAPTASKWFARELDKKTISIEKRRFTLFLILFIILCILIKESYSSLDTFSITSIVFICYFSIVSIFSLFIVFLFYKLNANFFIKLYNKTSRNSVQNSNREKEIFKRNIKSSLTKEICDLLYESDLIMADTYTSFKEIQEKAISGEQIFRKPKKGNADTFRALFDVIFKDKKTKIPNELYAPLFGYKAAKTIQITPNQHNIDDKIKVIIQKIKTIKRKNFL